MLAAVTLTFSVTLCPAGLHSEQSALVDFLVLARCQSYVGFSGSSFSILVPQYRALTAGGGKGGRKKEGERSSLVGGLSRPVADLMQIVDEND